tara:strand:- start:124 stop:504 length:381 start_codon:yes stop_codon:yes gene_type:complete
VTPIQIDSMIDRICGMYPTTPVPRNGMKALWREDALLLSIDVKQGREVMGLIERHNAIPSLPEIKGMVRTLLKEVVESLPNCEICNGTGWDDGLRIADGVILHERFTSIDMRGNVCTTVTKCECRK